MHYLLKSYVIYVVNQSRPLNWLSISVGKEGLKLQKSLLHLFQAAREMQNCFQDSTAMAWGWEENRQVMLLLQKTWLWKRSQSWLWTACLQMFAHRFFSTPKAQLCGYWSVKKKGLILDMHYSLVCDQSTFHGICNHIQWQSCNLEEGWSLATGHAEKWKVSFMRWEGN